MPKSKPAPKKKVASPLPPPPLVAPPPTMTESQPPLTIQQQLTQPINRPIVYDHLEMTEFSTAVERGPLTIDEIIEVMGIETETEYKKRMVAEDAEQGKEDPT